MHLVGFTIAIYHDARSSERQTLQGNKEGSFPPVSTSVPIHIQINNTSTEVLLASSGNSEFMLLISVVNGFSPPHYSDILSFSTAHALYRPPTRQKHQHSQSSPMFPELSAVKVER